MGVKSKQGDNFRACEKILYEYKNIDNDIEYYKITIEHYKDSNEFAELSAMQYDKDIISPTNSFSSTVETSVMKKDKIISLCEQRIKNLEYMKKKVNIVLKMLSADEYKLIELRYFSKEPLTWEQIGRLMNFNKDYAMVFRNKTINKLSYYLVSDDYYK